MQLNQYYTESVYSNLLVSNLITPAPSQAIDLGFGAGDLLHAAKRRWENLNLIGVDIDQFNVAHANNSTSIKALHYDGFNPDLPEVILEKYGNIDLLVSNPPYFAKEVDANSRLILKKVGLNGCITRSSKKLPAELIFLAQNLRLLVSNSELGIILPSGLISGEKWIGLREYLFSEFNVSKIIQLPVNSFRKTDAQAFILILNQSKKDDSQFTELSHVSHQKLFNISVKEAIHRADFNYYHSCSRGFETSGLDESEFFITRGNTPHSELKYFAKHYIHTTEMLSQPSSFSLPNYEFKNSRRAIEGDILLARVGRRCLGRVARVKNGSFPVSDCIIIIRPTSTFSGEKIWKKLSSSNAQRDLYDLSLGVGAKYITHSIIKDYLLHV
jgi:hypothetical protein